MTASTAPLSAAGRELPKRWLAIIATIWGGQAASMITSYAAGYAVVWYITETTGSAIMLAAAAICAYLPQGLLSPFGGVIADKHNRKTVMIVADLSVGIVSLGLGLPRPRHDGRHAAARAREAPAAHQHARPAAHVRRVHRRPRVRHLPVHHHRVPLRDVPRLRRSTRGRGGACAGEDPHRRR